MLVIIKSWPEKYSFSLFSLQQTKKLATVLQVARYSKKCWEALNEIFEIHYEETKKHLAQTVSE